ncbi:hypothetical protein B2G47_10930 [Leptospira interrogans serovar Canicola]|nr:hypothetical protein B2G47_10930 [Leptospira interrogans serovar Canicola]
MICESSHIILQTNLSFVVVSTFKESIYRVQIPTYKFVNSLRRTHVKLLLIEYRTVLDDVPYHSNIRKNACLNFLFFIRLDFF